MTKKNWRIGRRMMAAAVCMAAGFAVAGCGDKSTVMGAQRDADEAARRAASAGLPRPTDKLLDLVSSGQDQGTLEKEIQAHLSTYVVQNPPEKDLQESLTQITAASRAGVEPDVKSALEAERGTILLRLVDEKQRALAADLDDLTQKATTLQSLSQSAIELGAQADVLEKGKGTPAASDVNKAQASLTQAQQAVTAANEKVSKLQADIAAKEAQARQIYAQTDAAFLAADQKKGKEAIDAGNQAMEERKKAEQLMADAGNLQPQLALARSDLQLAQVNQKAAEEMLRAAQAAQSEATASTQQLDQRIAALRDAAKKIVQDKNGVSDLYKQLAAVAARLDPNIKDGAKYADQAAMAFNDAVNDYRTYRTQVREYLDKVQNTDAKDPLVALTKDDHMTALLTWSKAAAQEQAARVNLQGYQAATLVDAVSSQATKAFAAAGVSAEGKITMDGKTYQGQAAAKFTEARNTARSANSLTGTANPPLDLIKWLGYGVEAMACHGLYLTTGDKTALNEAQKARNEASSRNPLMTSQLSWIAE